MGARGLNGVQVGLIVATRCRGASGPHGERTIGAGGSSNAAEVQSSAASARCPSAREVIVRHRPADSTRREICEMTVMRQLAALLLASTCHAVTALRVTPHHTQNHHSHQRELVTRRELVHSAAAVVAMGVGRAAHADGPLPGIPGVTGESGEWAEHSGPFTDAFFEDFKSTDTGIKYKFVQMGEGDKPVPGQKVFMHYTGYLLNGKKFDSSYGKGTFGFRLGKGKVIGGWEATVAGMRPGMKVIVQIPPQYAYGSKGAGGGEMPPDSTLVFYMQLMALGNIKPLK